MLLIVGDAQLPAGIARVWILPHDLEQVGDLGVGMSGPPLQQRRVIERARILWAEGQSLVYARAGRSILFPLDLSQRDVGIGVGIVRPELHHLVKRLDRIGVLELVEIAD